ncbi:MAG TPA: tRNA guanosine(34) transglycosylase Tgt [Patescibacteria group bacterium]|nr:tRNA guanosine(34) transglycosylase Tgt [Patescibacteria group bacterium]
MAKKDKKYFKFKSGKMPLPVFFPDATRGVIKTLDSVDIASTDTPGILVNTFHLWQGLNKEILKKLGGIREFMNFNGAVISDSGGFQVMSVVKKGVIEGKITDEGVVFHPGRNRKVVFSPETSIELQMSLNVDMVVVLDDFTDPKVGHKEALESVERTLDWARRSKREFEKICKKKGLTKSNRPYLLGVVQGGDFMDLREMCTKELVKIGFDGLGWGGWAIENGKLKFDSAEVIAKNTPENYLLYGLGVGKPEDIIKCVELGYTIFDCVLPTRDGRHGRLYVYDVDNIKDIDIFKPNFYHYFDAKKGANLSDKSKISTSCDCLLCKNYSKGYLAHLYKIGDMSAMRLSSIHNLRFFSILMQKLQEKY